MRWRRRYRPISQTKEPLVTSPSTCNKPILKVNRMSAFQHKVHPNTKVRVHKFKHGFSEMNTKVSPPLVISFFICEIGISNKVIFYTFLLTHLLNTKLTRKFHLHTHINISWCHKILSLWWRPWGERTRWQWDESGTQGAGPRKKFLKLTLNSRAFRPRSGGREEPRWGGTTPCELDRDSEGHLSTGGRKRWEILGTRTRIIDRWISLSWQHKPDDPLDSYRLWSTRQSKSDGRASVSGVRSISIGPLYSNLGPSSWWTCTQDSCIESRPWNYRIFLDEMRT